MFALARGSNLSGGKSRKEAFTVHHESGVEGATNGIQLRLHVVLAEELVFRVDRCKNSEHPEGDRRVQPDAMGSFAEDGVERLALRLKVHHRGMQLYCNDLLGGRICTVAKFDFVGFREPHLSGDDILHKLDAHEGVLQPWSKVLVPQEGAVESFLVVDDGGDVGGSHLGFCCWVLYHRYV